MTRTVSFDVHNRWTGGKLQFTAQIECADDAPLSIKRGLAVQWAIKHDANLRRADLNGANLNDADLNGANLRRADLRHAKLNGAKLNGANLNDADLSGADLRRANLCDADLNDADLRHADLRHAKLNGANLRRANLRHADLRRANLCDADLNGANLNGADLNGADLNGTIGNMREVKSAQFDCWPITWTQPRDGEPILQIGCQKHPLSKWETSDPRWIACMDNCATAWWSQYRDVVLALVKASPAVPFEVKS